MVLVENTHNTRSRPIVAVSGMISYYVRQSDRRTDQNAPEEHTSPKFFLHC